jgi:hypothetical protein
MRTVTSTASVRRCAAAASVIAMLVLGACEDDPPDEPAPEPLVPADFADTYRLVRECRSSIDHELVNIEVLVNPGAEAAYVDGVYPFAPGTTLVKREFADAACSQLVGYTAMRRLEDGAAPEHGDWAWQRLDADLAVIELEPMAIAQCVACHTSCTEGRDLACTDP